MVASNAQRCTAILATCVGSAAQYSRLPGGLADTLLKRPYLNVGEFIKDTEEYINIELDSSRNRLIRLEIVLTAGTFAVAIWGLVGSKTLPNTLLYCTSTSCWIFFWLSMLSMLHVWVMSVHCLAVLLIAQVIHGADVNPASSKQPQQIASPDRMLPLCPVAFIASGVQASWART